MQRILKHTEQHKSAKKGGSYRYIGRTKGGLNTKLHAVDDGMGRPIALHLNGGNVSDYKGAVPTLPKAKHLLADKGYDANWFRNRLRERGIDPCIPAMLARKEHLY